MKIGITCLNVSKGKSLSGNLALRFVQLILITIYSLIWAPASAQLVRLGAGSAANLLPIVNAFRSDLGGGLNPNVIGSFGTGRREINWDGVPDGFSAPNNLPANFFNANSPRGAVFTTPGAGFMVSANAAIGPVRFDNINPTYSSLFSTFTAQRLFTALGSKVTDVSFFIPGSNTPASTRGFGAIFTDVDLANTTSIQYFDQNNNSLGIHFVPGIIGSNSLLSFLGVSFPTPIISRVRIISGNSGLGLNENLPAIDMVVMDDFIYGEPNAICPEIMVTIPDAFALPSGVLANTVYIGYLPASSLTLTSIVTGGTGSYNYTWSTGSNANAITVSPTSPTTYTLNVTDQNGCPGSGSKTVNVIDVRGGKKNDKVVICHKPEKQANTLTISSDGVEAHLAHGDMLGSCSLLNGITQHEAPPEITAGSSFKVKVIQNPSANYFSVRVEGNSKDLMKLRVVDMQGRVIEIKDNLQSNQIIKIGSSYHPGTYLVEIVQGQERKQLKLVKTN